MVEHGRITLAHASKRTHEPEERQLTQARVPRQFEEARKECFEHLECPFTFATMCIAIDDEERVVMVRSCEGVVGSTTLLVVIVMVLLGGEGGY